MTNAARRDSPIIIPSDPVELVKAAYHAFAAEDRATFEAMLASDFVFTSPLDNRISRDTYFKRCWPLSKNAGEFKYIHAVQSGEQVFLTYEAASKDGKKFRNTEIFTVRNGQIHEVEVYFGWDIPHKANAGGFTSE
jgi:ketosteroid isomerase-like protein